MSRRPGAPCTIRSESGYSLVELMIVVGLVGVFAGMATLQVAAVRPGLQGDGAARVVIAQLNLAREQAITQRRNMEITFIGTNGMRVTRHEFPTGTTVLTQISFEAGVKFGLVTGAIDTPEMFGNSTAISFGSAQTVMFGTDGSLVDSGGSPVNGTVFLILPETPQSFRAVTVLGATGRVRGYRWGSDHWMRM